MYVSGQCSYTIAYYATQLMYTKSFNDAHIQFLRGSMTLRALPSIELIHQVNVVKSAIVELRVWHNRWILEAVSFIYMPEDKICKHS